MVDNGGGKAFNGVTGTRWKDVTLKKRLDRGVKEIEKNRTAEKMDRGNRERLRNMFFVRNI